MIAVLFSHFPEVSYDQHISQIYKMSCAVVEELFLFSLLSGIGSGSAPLEQCIELAQRPGVLQHWTSCKQLVIDEISMVEAEFFDKLEAVAR